MAAAGSASEPFEESEAVVLSWLLTQPEVGTALELFLGGGSKKAEAEELLTDAVKSLLGEADADADACAASATGDTLAPESNKRRRIEEGATDAGPKEVSSGVTTIVAPDLAKRSRDDASGIARCVCIVMSGLHGSGKSALCNVLREVIGGKWLNVDELASKNAGKKNKEAFLSEFRNCLGHALQSASNGQGQMDDRIVFVDRSNTSKTHRSDLIQVLQKMKWKLRGGTILFVNFSHAADAYAYGPNGQLSKRFSELHIDKCASRVEARGAAHHTLHPSPKLRASLQATAKIAEAPTGDELAQFDARVCLEVTEDLPAMAARVLDEIRRLGWLASLRDPEKLAGRIEVAWQAYRRAETQWHEGASLPTELENPVDWQTQCRRAQAQTEAKDKTSDVCVVETEAPATVACNEAPPKVPVPTSWSLDLPEVSKVLEQRGILPSTFIPVSKPHTTLLALGEGDHETLAKKNNVSVDEFRVMLTTLEALQNEEFEVQMVRIVIETHVACAVVKLPEKLPCADTTPHVTFGTKPGTLPRYANDVLNEILSGRKEGVSDVQLPQPRPLTGRVTVRYG